MWVDGDLNWLQNKSLYDDAEKLVPPDAVGQFRADIARYEILHRYGGLYVDCDTVALKPIDSALEGHDAWAASEDGNWVGNTYVASVPGHPVVTELVGMTAHSVKVNRGKRPNKMTGPQFLTPIWRKHGCHVAESKLFYPYSYADVKRGTVPDDVGDAYATHLWQHTKEVMDRRVTARQQRTDAREQAAHEKQQRRANARRQTRTPIRRRQK